MLSKDWVKVSEKPTTSDILLLRVLIGNDVICYKLGKILATGIYHYDGYLSYHRVTHYQVIKDIE